MKIQDKIEKLQSLIEQGFVYIQETPIFRISKESDINIERLVWVDLKKWNEDEEEYEVIETIKCELLNVDIDDWHQDSDIVFFVKPIDDLPSDFNFEDYDIESWQKIYYHQISSFEINYK
jgi:DNA gyrase/topoisomerase IV subunit B